MSDENKKVEEVVEEVETTEENKDEKKKGAKKAKKGKKKKTKEVDFNKIIKDVFGTVNSLFTDSPSRGMVFVQGVMGLLLLSVFIGGFLGKLIGIILTFAGIVGVRGLSAELLGKEDNDEAEASETEETEE